MDAATKAKTVSKAQAIRELNRLSGSFVPTPFKVAYDNQGGTEIILADTNSNVVFLQLADSAFRSHLVKAMTDYTIILNNYLDT